MSHRLKEKVVIVTGGAGGIGSATGELFCREGASVMLVDHSQESLNQAVERIKGCVPNAAIAGLVADLSIEGEAERVVERVVREMDSVSVVVNNVAARRYEAIADAPWETWDEIVRVNLLSFVSMTRAALPHLRRCGRGSIINVSSVHAVLGRKGMGAYDATKAGVLALTRTLAYEEAEHNVRANAICPGFTRTPFHARRLGAKGVDDLVPPCLLGRWADPVEVAYPMLWLASDEASYVTGATFMIDGGLSA
ncbi:MAG: SDR family oxidoreductase [Paraburkholderia sp.]|nr:SDR family oxidoreductase [Paraburkholderia sp.]